MKTIAKTLLILALMMSTIVGCEKDEKFETKDTTTDTVPPTDTVPQTDTLIVVPQFDTLPASLDGFDIRGRWLWAEQNTPNRLLMTFRDDSIVVFKKYNYSLDSCYVVILDEIDSAKYRTVYNDSQLGNRVYFYHQWMSDGTVYRPEFSIYCHSYAPDVYDGQNTMRLWFMGIRLDDEGPGVYDFYAVRY